MSKAPTKEPTGAASVTGKSDRGPGRPRTEGYDDRILDAAIALIDRGETVTVNAVVAESGLSRAAIYRRWFSMTDLVAAALDRGRAQIVVDTTGDIKQTLLDTLVNHPDSALGESYTERRMRKRLELVMANPELQRAYWESHVSRRRVEIRHALEAAASRGELRDDLDLDACLDAIIGVSYYQLVVRGEAMSSPDAMRRNREAFEVIWRGMTR